MARFGTGKVKNGYFFSFLKVDFHMILVVLRFDVKHKFTLWIRLRLGVFLAGWNMFVLHHMHMFRVVHYTWTGLSPCVFFCDTLCFLCISPYQFFYDFSCCSASTSLTGLWHVRTLNSVSKRSNKLFRWKWICLGYFFAHWFFVESELGYICFRSWVETDLEFKRWPLQ